MVPDTSGRTSVDPAVELTSVRLMPTLAGSGIPGPTLLVQTGPTTATTMTVNGDRALAVQTVPNIVSPARDQLIVLAQDAGFGSVTACTATQSGGTAGPSTVFDSCQLVVNEDVRLLEPTSVTTCSSDAVPRPLVFDRGTQALYEARDLNADGVIDSVDTSRSLIPSPSQLAALGLGSLDFTVCFEDTLVGVPKRWDRSRSSSISYVVFTDTNHDGTFDFGTVSSPLRQTDRAPEVVDPVLEGATSLRLSAAPLHRVEVRILDPASGNQSTMLGTAVADSVGGAVVPLSAALVAGQFLQARDSDNLELSPPLQVGPAQSMAFSFSPRSGTLAGGERVVVQGVGLGDVVGATFGSTAAIVAKVTATSVTLVAPAAPNPSEAPILLQRPAGAAPIYAGTWLYLTVAAGHCGNGFCESNGLPRPFLVLPDTATSQLRVSDLRADGSGFGSAVTVGTDASDGKAACVIDADGDGDLDVVYGTQNTLRLRRRTGAGLSQLGPPENLATFTGSLLPTACGDVSGDGLPDIVLSNAQEKGRIYVLRNNGNASFTVTFFNHGQAFFTATKRSFGKILGDFNGDSRLDLAVFFEQFTGATQNPPANIPVVIFLNSGNQSAPFVAPGLIVPTSAPLSPSVSTWGTLAAGDFNGDGNVDLWGSDGLTGLSHAFWFLPGNGTGTFGAATQILSYSTLHPAKAVAQAIDADFDGRLDLTLAVGDTTEKRLQLFRGTGTGGVVTPAFQTLNGVATTVGAPAPTGETCHTCPADCDVCP